MADTHLPIQYRMEIYVDSFVNDPEATFYSSTPFLAVAVGDEMRPALWPNSHYLPATIAKVTAIQHIIYEIEGKHIGHSLSVCVEIMG